MLISKFNGKDGEIVSILINKKQLKETKNPDYVRIFIGAEYTIGLDNKETIKAKDLIDLSKIKSNTK